MGRAAFVVSPLKAKKKRVNIRSLSFYPGLLLRSSFGDPASTKGEEKVFLRPLHNLRIDPYPPPAKIQSGRVGSGQGSSTQYDGLFLFSGK